LEAKVKALNRLKHRLLKALRKKRVKRKETSLLAVTLSSLLCQSIKRLLNRSLGLKKKYRNFFTANLPRISRLKGLPRRCRKRSWR